jgi:hypothetical protein
MLKNILLTLIFCFCFNMNGAWLENGYVHTIEDGQEYAYKDNDKYLVTVDEKGNKHLEFIGKNDDIDDEEADEESAS